MRPDRLVRHDDDHGPVCAPHNDAEDGPDDHDGREHYHHDGFHDNAARDDHDDGPGDDHDARRYDDHRTAGLHHDPATDLAAFYDDEPA